MNATLFKQKWKQLRDRIRNEWSDLSEEDMDRIDGRLDQLLGEIEQTYKIPREEATARLEQILS